VKTGRDGFAETFCSSLWFGTVEKVQKPGDCEKNVCVLNFCVSVFKNNLTVTESY